MVPDQSAIHSLHLLRMSHSILRTPEFGYRSHNCMRTHHIQRMEKLKSSPRRLDASQSCLGQISLCQDHTKSLTFVDYMLILLHATSRGTLFIRLRNLFPVPEYENVPFLSQFLETGFVIASRQGSQIRRIDYIIEVSCGCCRISADGS